MVRLKDPNLLPIAQLSRISIPYGAIKRLYTPVCCYNNDKFQFLMVRLKALIIVILASLYSIFQFLMVRLKDTSKKIIPQAKGDFNSLWCD